LSQARELVHGTCVAFGRRAALLRGNPAAGKSDLALRFLALPAEGETRPLLVADDQVFIEAGADGALLASPPPTLAGKIEVRGLGIVEVPFLAEAELVLVCDLVGGKEVPRMPPETWERTVVAGIAVPSLTLAPFEASAPLKLKMALFLVAPVNPK
jgi:HPr kinase/phosphorylase